MPVIDNPYGGVLAHFDTDLMRICVVGVGDEFGDGVGQVGVHARAEMVDRLRIELEGEWLECHRVNLEEGLEGIVFAGFPDTS